MPSLSLRKKLKDAQGKPIEADTLYTPISPHGRGFIAYNPGVELRGSHEAVKAVPSLWIAAETGSDEKVAALSAYRARRDANEQPAAADPQAPRILGPIPRERRRVALRDYHDKAGRIIWAGSIWDANDEFVKGNPDMFGPEAA